MTMTDAGAAPFAEQPASAPAMVERVARAIYETQRRYPRAEWENEHPGVRAVFMREARAAIREMRKPTPEMLKASWRCTVSASAEERMKVALTTPQDGHNYKSRQRWKAMIDAALGEREA